MKRICLSFALALLCVLAGCQTQPEQLPEKLPQSTEVFRVQDVTAVLPAGRTVADYIQAVKPNKFSWVFLGNDAKQTQLTMQATGGNLIVVVQAQKGVINGKADGDAVTLPQAVLALNAAVTGIEWMSRDFGIPTVRGVNINDNREKVLSSYLRKGSADAMYSLKDVKAEAEQSWIADWAFVGGRFIAKGGFYDYDTLEYGWCELKGASDWKLYYNLSYQMENDKVRAILLYIQGDETDAATP